MKQSLLAASLVAFSWFHTRPKPVILEEEPAAQTAKQTRVVYRGTAMYPGTGRLYFPDKADEARGTSRSKTVTTFTQGWKTGSTKVSPAKSSK